MDCDDFSISSHEAESIDDDLWCFEKISRDPTAFWDEGMDPVRIPFRGTYRWLFAPGHVGHCHVFSFFPLNSWSKQQRITKLERTKQ
jgi:hypothetical protein